MRLLFSLGLLKLGAALPQGLSSTITGQRSFCDNEPCLNGGECHTQIETGKWFCDCASGWNGPTCEIPNPELTCGTSQIQVIIDKRMVKSRDNADQWISFGDSEDDESCMAQLDGDVYKLTIHAPFADKCGTRASRADGDSGDYVFSNDVTWKRLYAGSDGEAAIQRRVKLVDFNCHYEDEYLLQMIPIKPAEQTIEQATEKGNFKVDMTLWKNSDFERDPQSQYSSNPIVRVGHEVCVKLEVDSLLDDDSLVLTASDCWASAVSNPTDEDKHPIIEKKCISDADYTTIVKENGSSDVVKFCFKVYKWNTAMDNLYVQCKMSVCDDSISIKGHSQCSCPPKSYKTNDWFYPNYYDANMDALNRDLYSDYYQYGAYYNEEPGLRGLPNDNYNSFYYYDNNNDFDLSSFADAYGGLNANDFFKKRKRRDTSENEAPTESDEAEEKPAKLAQESGSSSLPTEQKNKDLLIKAAPPQKRKRLELINDKIKKDEDGKLILPEGLKVDPSKDLIDVGYGPIIVKDELDEVAAVERAQALSDVVIAEIENEDIWYDMDTSEGANNVILIAVGGSLIFAIIVLGIVIFVYVQFKNEADAKTAKIIEDKKKVKAFVHGMNKQAKADTASKAPLEFEPETASTGTEQ